MTTGEWIKRNVKYNSYEDSYIYQVPGLGDLWFEKLPKSINEIIQVVYVESYERGRERATKDVCDSLRSFSKALGITKWPY